MAYRARRGFGGDVLNPTAGTALDCGLFAGGVFNKACWCLEYPSLCSSADYQAAYALAHPEVYSPILEPPPPPAPGGDALTTPPESGTQAQQTVDALIAQQNAAWKAQNSATMARTAANLAAVAQSQCPGQTLIQNDDGSFSCPPDSSSFPWGLVLGIGAAVVGVLLIGGRR